MAIYADGASVWLAIKSLDVHLWLAILGLSLGNYLLRYWRWHLYIGQPYQQGFTHLKHLCIYLAGFALTTTPGKAGEGLRTFYLHRYGVTHSRSLAALLVERLMDLFAISLMAIIGFWVLVQAQLAMHIALAVALVLIIGVFFAIKLPFVRCLEKDWFLRLPHKVQKIACLLIETLSAANQLLSWRLLVFGLLLGLVAWGLEVWGLLIVMQQYQVDSHFYLAAAVYGAAILLGSLSMSPGGLGASELLMASLLVMAKFDMPSAIAITYICRIATLWFAVLIGLLCLFIMYILGIKPQLAKEA